MSAVEVIANREHAAVTGSHRVDGGTVSSRNARLQAFWARTKGGACGQCDRPLTPNEAVYWGKVPVGGWGRWAFTVLGACCAQAERFPAWYRSPRACEGCGRPVHPGRQSRATHVLCSEHCGYVVRYRRRPDREPIDCAVCGERLDARRADTRYCSDACRMVAYRARKAATA